MGGIASEEFCPAIKDTNSFLVSSVCLIFSSNCDTRIFLGGQISEPLLSAATEPLTNSKKREQPVNNFQPHDRKNSRISGSEFMHRKLGRDVWLQKMAADIKDRNSNI